MTVIVNDVLSRLNPTAVHEIVRPESIEELQAAVRGASNRSPIALCGGRHAMGGQQFRSKARLVDTSGLAGVLRLDDDRGLVEVEAGVQWPALMDALAGTPWSITQTHVGANGRTVGGAVSSNAHGPGLAMAPVGADVERLVVVGADGELRSCSREANPALFRSVLGGYGLFGAIATATIRLMPRSPVERLSDGVVADNLADRFARARAEGCLYGEAELECDPASDEFLRAGTFTAYRPAPNGSAGGPTLDADSAHRAALRADPPWPGSSVMLTELVVPRPAVAAFLAAAAHELRERQTEVMRCSVRIVERDDETTLTWARADCACAELRVHVEHDAVAVGRAADALRALIDVALAHGGTYHLAYHRWARRDQVERAYPRIHEFIAAKREHDPHGVFQSDWYAHLCRLLEVSEAA